MKTCRLLRIICLFIMRPDITRRGKNMYALTSKITLFKISKALRIAYAFYTMKGTFTALPTLNVEGIQRINWSGCE
jgi:hypothetical protein